MATTPQLKMIFEQLDPRWRVYADDGKLTIENSRGQQYSYAVPSFAQELQRREKIRLEADLEDLAWEKEKAETLPLRTQQIRELLQLKWNVAEVEKVILLESFVRDVLDNTLFNYENPNAPGDMEELDYQLQENLKDHLPGWSEEQILSKFGLHLAPRI